MNIHEYIEKRASRNPSLMGKYRQLVYTLSEKVGGKDPRKLRTIPGAALQTLLTPIQTAKDLPEFFRVSLKEVKDARNSIKGLRGDLKDPNLSPSKREYLKERLKEETDYLKDFPVATGNMLLGSGAGYGALSYGGYKGGQKVKDYLQEKGRK
tara:strand:+ start:899 stop:1357 length:459 start_codon:yes stop_codon:yes gene_type:complete